MFDTFMFKKDSSDRPPGSLRSHQATFTPKENASDSTMVNPHHDWSFQEQFQFAPAPRAFALHTGQSDAHENNTNANQRNEAVTHSTNISRVSLGVPQTPISKQRFHASPAQGVSQEPRLAQDFRLFQKPLRPAESIVRDVQPSQAYGSQHSRNVGNHHQRALDDSAYFNSSSPRMHQMQPLQQQRMAQSFPARDSIDRLSMEGYGISSSPQLVSSPSNRLSLRHSHVPSKTYEPSSNVYNEFDDDEISLLLPYENRSYHAVLSHSEAGPPVIQGIRLVSTSLLPDRLRQTFSFRNFNAVQSKCFDALFHSDNNVVVSAPTGGGKTVLLELAICRLVDANSSGDFKVVYQAPTKSLCSERARDWEKKFRHLHLNCAELTGDTDMGEMKRVGNADIIVTTPEKWDSITRKWKDHVKLLRLVKLFLIDEVHILKESRGAVLEAVVSRMKTIGTSVRFVALSATVPNSEDIAAWLGLNHNNAQIPAYREVFGETFRPVQLERHVHGFDNNLNDFAFDSALEKQLPSIVVKYSQRKPILVFCFTRKSCESTAAKLSTMWVGQRGNERSWPAPSYVVVVKQHDLQELLKNGVAFHHAGMESADRQAVENGYLHNQISVIVCTSTLAVGVNLPCHLVIIKGTMLYSGSGLVDYSDIEIMQMLGRAGRPQFDSTGIAVIMTRKSKVEHYERMVTGNEILESTLHLNLIEHLNSEVKLGTVHNLQSGKAWLASTFLAVRMRQNPKHYKLDCDTEHRSSVEKLEQVCERDIKLLQDAGLVSGCPDGKLTSTEYGNAMSAYMIAFNTMKLFLSIPYQAKLGLILHVVCQAAEFNDLRMKPNERSIFRELNKSALIRFPIKENVTTYAHKVSLIIQVQLGGLDLPPSINAIRAQYQKDKSIVMYRIKRLLRCVVDCKAVDRDSVATRHALDLERSLRAGYWEGLHDQLRQVEGIGPAMTRKLLQANVKTIGELAALESADIERIASRNPPFGKKIQDSAARFPCLSMKAELNGKTIKVGNPVRVQIRAQLEGKTTSKKFATVTFLAEVSNGNLAHFWRGPLKTLEKGFQITFSANMTSHDDFITCYVACDDVVGVMKSVTIRPEIPASAFRHAVIKPTTPQQAIFNNGSEFDEDDLADDDLLVAMNEVDNRQGAKEHQDLSVEKDMVYDEFSDIDDLDQPDDIGQDEQPNHRHSMYTAKQLIPVKMANGKWMCWHECKDNGVTRSGKKCSHKCCREGLDKPRKNPKQPQADGVKRPSSGDIGQNVAKKVKQPTLQQKLTYSGGISLPRDIEELNIVAQTPEKIRRGAASKDYDRLRDLHAKVQGGHVTRRHEVHRPAYSYSHGSNPELSVLNVPQEDVSVPRGNESMLDEDMSLPSLSALVDDSQDMAMDNAQANNANLRDFSEKSDEFGEVEEYETAMIGMEDSLMLQDKRAEKGISTSTIRNSGTDAPNDLYSHEDFDDKSLCDDEVYQPDRTVLTSPDQRPSSNVVPEEIDCGRLPEQSQGVSRSMSSCSSAIASSSKKVDLSFCPFADQIPECHFLLEYLGTSVNYVE